MNKPHVFISYSSVDKDFAHNLARRLSESAVDVWIDLWNIKVGDSIVQKINDGLERADFLIVLLSKASVESKWVREELSAATMRNVEADKRAFILPVIIEDVEVPPLLRHRKYADFRNEPEVAFQLLLDAIRPLPYILREEPRSTDPMSVLQLGIVLLKTGRLREAIAAFRQVLDEKPEFPEALTNLGIALHQSGNLDAAIEAHEKAVSLRPNDFEALINLGGSLYAQERYDEALAMYRRAYQARPGSSEVFYNIGNVFAKKGRLNDAVEQYEAALKLDPNFTEARYNLGRVTQSIYQTLYNRGNEHLRAGRLDEAIATYAKALRIASQHDDESRSDPGPQRED